MSTVMIVDDSKTSRSMLRNILVEHGYEVIAEAENGQEGYEKYCELKPDIVTLDITMPVMDGIETLIKIKEYDGSAKVIMVTAAGQKGKMLDAIKLGAAEFVTKPYETNQIVNIIESIK
ncbi:MAG: response regulator [Lachnospiraceae bacterium]|nr:response regulator [Lachnospiraceae bacterium]